MAPVLAGKVHFCVVYCAKFLNDGQQNGVTWKDMIDRSVFWMRQCGWCSYLFLFEFLTGDFLNFGQQNGVIVKDMIDLFFWIWNSVADLCSFSFLLLCNFLTLWVTNRRNLKRHDWHIKFSSMEHYGRCLSQFDFFEQTLDWQLV